MLLLLCLLAAVHVFIFSAAFPFFNVVDEQLHFDTVVKYSHGEVPRTLDMPHPEALQFISIYGTIEYLWSPAMLADRKIPPPPWTLPMDQVAQNLLAKEAVWKEKVKNTESSQPPLYYSLAAAWWRLGKIFGLDGGTLLYWLRFMNIPVMVALVWLGWYSARLVFPDDVFVRLGVPALIAVLPQTAFYAIQNDVLSPLCFGLAFAGLVKLLRADIPDRRLAAFTGLALAATFLTKISNLPLLAVSAAAVLFKTFQLARAGKLPPSLPALLTLALCASLPAAAWVVWCKMNFGDFTGTAAKIQILGWTHKPFAEWWHHPIFTPHGLWTFFSGVMATFWQGELLWDRQPLALPAASLIYTLLSLILAGLALFNLRPHSKSLTPPQRQALWLGFACIAAAVVFLGFLSIIYDFHDCFYPSRAHPYFTSGRLMLGALIPFLLLFVFGLDRAMKNLKTAAKFCVLAGIMLFMLVTEITTDWAIFPNAYNWFHM
jgi:hypothetical protein